MPRNKLSITKATEIFDYWGELIGKHDGIYYPSSSLEFKDVSNSINLIIAYDYFNLPHFYSEEKLLKLENWVNQISGSCIKHYHRHFLLDDIFNRILSKYSKDSFEYKTQGADLSLRYFEFLRDNHFYNRISEDEFFKFCVSLGNRNTLYWELVYQKLGLEIDNSDLKLPVKKVAIKTIERNKFNENLDLYLVLITGVYLVLFLIFCNYRESVGYHYFYFVIIYFSYFLSKSISENVFFKREKALPNKLKILSLVSCAMIVFGISLSLFFFRDNGLDIQRVFEWFTTLIIPCLIGVNESIKKDTDATLQERKEIKSVMSSASGSD